MGVDTVSNLTRKIKPCENFGSSHTLLKSGGKCYKNIKS